jgi:hypothetical protein
MEEVWKTIENYENYQVSSFGNVRNVISNKNLKLSNKSGYYHVNLTNHILRKICKVHRLVALAFFENPENKAEVNHKDKNKLNNHLENLEWNTRKENNFHRNIGLNITSNKNKGVLKIDNKTNELIEKFNSIELAGTWAFQNNLTATIHNGRNSIGNCLNGLSKMAYGFKWEYENKNNDLKEEVWKPIIFEEKEKETDTIYSKNYFVSNLGRFKNSFGVIMENYKVNENGYIRVFINNKTYYLHRLIAKTFISNSFNKKQVNHKDGNKLNNNINNLEWMTNQENQIHKFKNGLGNNFTRSIVQYDLQMNEMQRFHSITEAANLLNIGKSNIRGVLTNNRKTAGGFIFKYLD